MNLRQKMVFGGIAAVVIPFLISGIITYNRLTVYLETTSRESKAQIAWVVSNLFQTDLTHKMGLASILASDQQIAAAASAGDFLGVEEKLKEAHAVFGNEYDDFFIADTDGIVRVASRTRERIGIVVSDRDYFLKAKAGNANISEPVVSRATGSLIVIVAAPIHSETGTLAGVFAATIDINTLIATLSSLTIGETGFFSIINREGLVLVHPRAEFILTLNMYNEPGMEGISEKVRAGMAGSENYSFRGVRKIAGFAPIPLTGWRIIVAQNRDEIMAPARQAYETIILIGFALMMATILIIILSSKTISSPIEKALETFRQIMLHSADIMVKIGSDGRIASVNQAYEKILGRRAEQLVGTMAPLRNTAGMPEEAVWKILRAGKIWSGRLSVPGENCAEVMVEVLIIPIRDERGRIHTFMEIGRDITQELILEKRLSQTQKIEAIGTLAGGIAHDFNNILGGIFGYGDLALKSTGEPEKVRKYIQELLLAAERARDLVNQIMTFSRGGDSELKPVTPRLVIREALRLLRATIPKTIEVSAELESGATILGDSTKLHQLIINLCTNSVYAMKDGRGTLDVRLDDVDEGRQVRLNVSDTGCGIPPKDLEHIFEPFFTTKPKGEGTGLGLSVVHGIVKSMGGNITVTSDVGRGTTVSILIPVVSPGTLSAEKNSGGEIPGGSGRILVVDDESQVVKATSAILDELGYSAETWTDSILALKRFREDPRAYDLVILDHMMPQMTGIELAAAIKEARSDIPVILYSGYTNQNIMGKSAEAGITAVLKKPARMEELAAAVRGVLGVYK